MLHTNAVRINTGIQVNYGLLYCVAASHLSPNW